MNFDRRAFLKLIGLAGFTGTGYLSKLTESEKEIPYKLTSRQRFNMHGYAAPKLDSVRIGIIGVGNRGSGSVRRLARIEGTDIKAVCDLEQDRVDAAIESIEDTHSPNGYSGSEEAWKQVCERGDIDLIYICTPWHLHTPMAVYAMENGKHAATEIPAAQTIDQCWELVETSEKTRRHCMMLENTCYDFFEMITLKMAREGFLGEIVHGEGAYIHQLMDGYMFNKKGYHNNWRLHENINRNGNLYPMHGLGPIANAMNINCGDKMDYLVSMSGNDFMMRDKANELAEQDKYWEPYTHWDYRGNMNTSIIRTHRGRTILLQHDVSSPRPYSRIHLLSGTKGIARKWPLPARIATGHGDWLSDEEFTELEKKYTPEITRRVGEMARKVGGHGGMDTLMDWRLIDCLRNGLPLDMNVYDAALWSSVIPLSERSVANGSEALDIPDFTGGAWKTNGPGMDIELKRGGTTRVL